MFAKLIIALLAAATAAGVAVRADAQGADALHPDPFFRSLSLAEGLPSSEVAKIVDDRDGFIWIGTHDGLVRYDGV
ncbi:MAG: two-component regulator propeller domain-containing protein, partial [Rudaea sp.]